MRKGKSLGLTLLALAYAAAGLWFGLIAVSLLVALLREPGRWDWGLFAMASAGTLGSIGLLLAPLAYQNSQTRSLRYGVGALLLCGVGLCGFLSHWAMGSAVFAWSGQEWMAFLLLCGGLALPLALAYGVWLLRSGRRAMGGRL